MFIRLIADLIRNKKKVIPPYVTKNTMLFSAHFSRLWDHLDPKLQADTEVLVKQAHQMLLGVIEIAASNRWLIPTLESIWIAQMATQAVWSETARMGRNTQLLQLPHFTEELVRKCGNKKWKIDTVPDFMKLDAAKKRELLSGDLSEKQIQDIEVICNKFPNDIDFTPKTEVDDDDENFGITAGAIVTLLTNFTRPSQPKKTSVTKGEDEPVEVHCPFYPAVKNEVWWLIVAEERTNLIMGLKRIAALRDELEIKIPFQAPR